MYMPTVDIIIPCYNAQNIIKQCIHSVMHQKYNNQINIYLINDGSTDDTLKILNSFIDYPNIHIINNPTNAGRSVTRNKGIFSGNGEVLLFLDSDMTVQTNWVESHIKILEYDNVVGVVGDYKLPTNQTPNKLDKYLYHPKRGARKFKNNAHIPFRYFLFSNTAIKREVFNVVGPFNENIIEYGGEDTDLAIRIWEKFPHKLKFTNQATSEHNNNKTIYEFYNSMYIYGNKNLPLLLKKYSHYKNDLGGQYIHSIIGYLIFNPIIRLIIKIMNRVITNYWLSRYIVIDCVIRGARNAKNI